MRNVRFWLPVIIGAILTPVCFYLVQYSIPASSGHAGAGMLQLMVLYPLQMLAMMFLAKEAGDGFFIRLVVLSTVWLQFPFYGFVLSYAKLKQSWWLKLGAGIVSLHIIAILAFVMIFFIRTTL